MIFICASLYLHIFGIELIKKLCKVISYCDTFVILQVISNCICNTNITIQTYKSSSQPCKQYEYMYVF